MNNERRLRWLPLFPPSSKGDGVRGIGGNDGVGREGERGARGKERRGIMDD